MTDHDRLFKELLSTFFIEFLELFLPQVAQTLDRNSVRFLQQEHFADLTTGEDKIVDLLVEVKQAGDDIGFIRNSSNASIRSSSSPLMNRTEKKPMSTRSSFRIGKCWNLALSPFN